MFYVTRRIWKQYNFYEVNKHLPRKNNAKFGIFKSTFKDILSTFIK